MTDSDAAPHTGTSDAPDAGDPADAHGTDPDTAVTDPSKLIRLGSMVQALMAEVRSASPDEAGRQLLARIHSDTMSELAEVLSPDLMAELNEFNTCCNSDRTPSESELRIAQAQLVGWLQGLLQGFQASAVAQQAQAMRQLQQMGSGGPQGGGFDSGGRTGQYL